MSGLLDHKINGIGIIMDGSGWHTEDMASDFNNLSVIKLPSYSPELNPIELCGVGCGSTI